MEFYYEDDYECWSYDADYEELEKAKMDIVLDTIKWKISRKTGKKEFTKEEINSFKVIAGLIVDGQFESINDDEFMYDDLKDYFYDKSRKTQDIKSLAEIEDEEYKISKGMM